MCVSAGGPTAGDPLGVRGLDVRAVLVAPLLGLEALAVSQNQYAEMLLKSAGGRSRARDALRA